MYIDLKINDNLTSIYDNTKFKYFVPKFRYMC